LNASYAWAYFARGGVRYQKENPKGALVDFDHAVKLDPALREPVQQLREDIRKIEKQKKESED
jgi:hypothetical protein